MNIDARIHTDQWAYNHRTLELREQHRGWLQGQGFTHFVTLNFHARYTAEGARRHLKLWFKNVLGRLMKPKSVRSLEPRSVLFFMAFPEDTRKDEPHFHLLARVAPQFTDYFEQIAARLWENCMHSGTCDVQRIGATDHDVREVVTYATKNAHRHFSLEGYVISTELEA